MTHLLTQARDDIRALSAGAIHKPVYYPRCHPANGIHPRQQRRPEIASVSPSNGPLRRSTCRGPTKTSRPPAAGPASTDE
jgi:hypothetical protein